MEHPSGQGHNALRKTQFHCRSGWYVRASTMSVGRHVQDSCFRRLRLENIMLNRFDAHQCQARWISEFSPGWLFFETRQQSFTEGKHSLEFAPAFLQRIDVECNTKAN